MVAPAFAGAFHCARPDPIDAADSDAATSPSAIAIGLDSMLASAPGLRTPPTILYVWTGTHLKPRIGPLTHMGLGFTMLANLLFRGQ